MYEDATVERPGRRRAVRGAGFSEAEPIRTTYTDLRPRALTKPFPVLSEGHMRPRVPIVVNFQRFTYRYFERDTRERTELRASEQGRQQRCPGDRRVTIATLKLLRRGTNNRPSSHILFHKGRKTANGNPKISRET